MEVQLIDLYNDDKDYTGEYHFCLTSSGDKYFGKVYLDAFCKYYCEVLYEIESDFYPFITHIILIN